MRQNASNSLTYEAIWVIILWGLGMVKKKLRVVVI
jgi:hypothetical protein